MAKVVSPLNSSEAHGSVGGITYKGWKGIHCVTSKPNGNSDWWIPEPNPSRYIALAVASWRRLSYDQQQEWHAIAVPQSTGFTTFAGRYAKALNLGYDTPPTPTLPPTLGYDNLQLSWADPGQGQAYAIWAPTASAPGAVIAFYESSTRNPGRQPDPHRMHLAGYGDLQSGYADLVLHGNELGHNILRVEVVHRPTGCVTSRTLLRDEIYL